MDFDGNLVMTKADIENLKAKQKERISQGQQLYAKIKKSSKYFGQGEPGALFKVFVDAGHPEEYLVKGGSGGQYRLADVNLFVVVDECEVRIS